MPHSIALCCIIIFAMSVPQTNSTTMHLQQAACQFYTILTDSVPNTVTILLTTGQCSASLDLDCTHTSASVQRHNINLCTVWMLQSCYSKQDQHQNAA